jgi:peptidoglycan-N-acetylglucosamine deacetylase
MKPALLALALVALLGGLPGPTHGATLTVTPTALTAVAKNSRYIQLTWHRSSGDDGTYRYRVFRDGIAIGARQSTVSYLDRPALGHHLYRVRAYDSLGNASSLTSAVGVWSVSKLPGAVAPAKPTNLAGSTRANGHARLTWSAGSGGTSATHLYRVYRNGMAIGAVTSTTFDDYRAGLRANTYDYTVQAVDANGYTSAMTSAVQVAVTPSLYPWAGHLYFSGPSTQPWVALTFDDCYSGSVVARLAQILRSYNAAATFFCTGEAAVLHPDVIANVARDFPVGNHTWDHPNLNYLTDSEVLSELTKATRKVEAATGRPMPPIMRPPYGSADASVRADCALLGFAVVRWNIDTNDWRKTQTSQGVLDAALQAKSGNIVIMHDRTKTADVLGQIITGLRAKGYRLVTVPQLLGIPWQAAEPDY